MKTESDGLTRSPARQTSRLIHLLAEDQRKDKKHLRRLQGTSAFNNNSEPRSTWNRIAREMYMRCKARVDVRAEILTQIFILRRDPGRPLMPPETRETLAAKRAARRHAMMYPTPEPTLPTRRMVDVTTGPELGGQRFSFTQEESLATLKAMQPDNGLIRVKARNEQGIVGVEEARNIAAIWAGQACLLQPCVFVEEDGAVYLQAYVTERWVGK